MADTVIAQTVLNELPANIGSALALVPTLEWAKRSTAPWLAWVNQKTAPVIAILAAALLAAGIHQTFSFHDGVLSWTVTGLTLSGVAQALFEITKQWLGQHWSYKLYQAFDTLKSVAVALNKLTDTATPSVSGATKNETGDGR